MTNPGSAAAPQADRLEIPAQDLRDTIIRLFNSIGGSPEERSAFLRNPKEYLARLLPVEEGRQLRVRSIDAILAALAQSAEPVRDGTSAALARLVEQAFSAGSHELPDGDAASYSACGTPYLTARSSNFNSTVNVNTNWNWNWNWNYNYNYSTKKSGEAEDDPRRSPARLRAALETYECK